MTTTADIMAKVEEAIRLASRLGDDAFDHIEGRGLHQIRLEIQARLADALEASDKDRERLDWLIENATRVGTGGHGPAAAMIHSRWVIVERSFCVEEGLTRIVVSENDRWKLRSAIDTAMSAEGKE